MALIKCPECGNKISDQADSCPKCGYENKIICKKKSLNNKNKYIIVLIAALLFLCTIYLVFPKRISIKNYSSNYLGISFDYRSDYVVKTNDDGSIYLAKHYQENNAVIPYIVITRYDDYRIPILFFYQFTKYMQNEYGNTLKYSSIANKTIGDKLVSQVTYNYTVDNDLIIDNRNVIIINDKIYLIGSKDTNKNNDEINNLVELIIKTIKEGVE